MRTRDEEVQVVLHSRQSAFDTPPPHCIPGPSEFMSLQPDFGMEPHPELDACDGQTPRSLAGRALGLEPETLGLPWVLTPWPLCLNFGYPSGAFSATYGDRYGQPIPTVALLVTGQANLHFSEIFLQPSRYGLQWAHGNSQSIEVELSERADQHVMLEVPPPPPYRMDSARVVGTALLMPRVPEGTIPVPRNLDEDVETTEYYLPSPSAEVTGVEQQAFAYAGDRYDPTTPFTLLTMYPRGGEVASPDRDFLPYFDDVSYAPASGLQYSAPGGADAVEAWLFDRESLWWHVVSEDGAPARLDGLGEILPLLGAPDGVVIRASARGHEGRPAALSQRRVDL